MKRVMLIFLKASIIAIVIFIFVFFINMIIQDDKKESSYYLIKIGNAYHKTKNITTLPDNSIEFFDVDSRRKVIVRDKYIIFNPKNQ